MVGRPLRLDNRVFTVAGVLEPFPYYRNVDVYLPVSQADIMTGLNQRENHNNSAVTARLRPGVSAGQARAELVSIAGTLERQYPGSNKGISIRLMPLQECVVAGARTPLLLLSGAVLLVLLIACVNVANLMTARTLARQFEIAVREALGANPWRIARQLLAESLLLGLAGTVAGLFVARTLVPVLARFSPDSLDSRLAEPNAGVFVFALLAAILTSLLFGVVPAVQAARVRFYSSMKDGSRSSSSIGQRRFRSALVVVQIALALVLLVGSGLLLRSLAKVLQQDLGFRTDHILTVRVLLPDSEDGTLGARHQFDAMIERMEASAGVQSAAAISYLPLTGENSNANFSLEGAEPAEGMEGINADYRGVSPNYFHTMGIPLLRGRLFNRRDGIFQPVEREKVLEAFRAASPVVIVNDSMARRFWPNQDPIGRRFRFGPPSFRGPWCTIVGVVGNTRSRNYESPLVPEFYFPSFQAPMMDAYLVVRATGDLTVLERAVRRIALEVEPASIVAAGKTMEQVAAGSIGSRRTNLVFVGLFAALALLLAVLGIYGVMAYSVNLRRHEFGVRLAVGATPASVLRLVLGGGVRLAIAGVAVGILLSIALVRWIAGMLYGIRAGDPATYAAAAGMLIVVAVLAAFLPARRATQVDPVRALRAE